MVPQTPLELSIAFPSVCSAIVSEAQLGGEGRTRVGTQGSGTMMLDCVAVVNTLLDCDIVAVEFVGALVIGTNMPRL